MPSIITIENAEIRIYFEDHNPPHVHVITAETEALVAIRDRRILAGELPAPRRRARAILAWIADNEEELLARWNDYQ